VFFVADFHDESRTFDSPSVERIRTPGASDAGDFDGKQWTHQSYAFVKSFARFGARTTRAEAMMSQKLLVFSNLAKPWGRSPVFGLSHEPW